MASRIILDAKISIMTSISQIDEAPTTRTTLALRDDAHATVKRFAEEHSVSMGDAASELIMRGASRPLPTHVVNGLHIPILPPSGVKLTSEMVKKLQSEQDVEEMEKVLPYLRKRKR
jgi:hypothetical protein